MTPDYRLPADQPGKTRDLAAALKAKLKHAYSTWDFRGYERDELDCVLGFKAATERLLASNLKLRVKACDIMSSLFGKLRKEGKTVPRRSFCFGSFLGPLVNEYRPELDIAAYRAAIYKLIHQQGLNAVYGIELQALTNYPQRGRGRSLLMNAHALLWTDDPGFDASDAQTKMRESTRLFSELGAPTVTLKDRTLDRGQLEYCGRYMLKPPLDGKRRARHDEIPSRWVLKPVLDVRPALLLRLAEIQSYFDQTELVWGVGEGTKIRLEWKRQLTAWNKLQCGRTRLQLEADYDTADLWNGVRARRGNGSRHYCPPQFRSRLLA